MIPENYNSIKCMHLCVDPYLKHAAIMYHHARDHVMDVLQVIDLPSRN